MSFFSRIKSAWGGFWGESSGGWVPVDSGNGPIGKGTEEKWLSQAAYFACIRNISEDIGKLPLITYKRNDRGKKRATTHKYYKLLRVRPHPVISSGSLRETMIRFALGWGNGYAKILRQNNGDAYAIEPQHPMYVTPKNNGKGGVEYHIKKPGKENNVVRSENMIHIHGVGSDGVQGMSIAAYANESLMLSKGAQTFGTNLYTRNGRPGGFLWTEAKLKDDVRKANAEAWKNAHGGNNMGGTAMLDNGLKYEQVTVNPSDAQYIETRMFTVEEIARWFRMPIHKLQHIKRAQGWSTLDATNTDYLTDTLLPWLIRIEQELTYKLFDGGDQYFAEHLVNGLLRGDAKTRAEYYVKMFSIGGLSINEIRTLENMNKIDGAGGDTHFVPLNMTPAEFAKSVSGDSSADENKNMDQGEDAMSGLVPISYYDSIAGNNGNGKNRL